MDQEGPPVEVLIRRLAECPPALLEEPHTGRAGKVHVPAVVFDLLSELGGPADPDQLKGFVPDGGKQSRNRAKLILVACWLLFDPWFKNRSGLAANARGLLAEGLNDLAGLVPAGDCVTDRDRREELARLSLAALGYRPSGETPAQAQDRLMTLSSAARARVIREAKAAEERARSIREAMAKKAAAEAAAKVMRE
jgi:hypothetical protein